MRMVSRQNLSDCKGGASGGGEGEMTKRTVVVNCTVRVLVMLERGRLTLEQEQLSEKYHGVFNFQVAYSDATAQWLKRCDSSCCDW